MSAWYHDFSCSPRALWFSVPGRTQLVFCVPSYSGLTQLVELELEGCEHLTGEGLRSLRPLTALRALSLNACGNVKGGLQHVAGGCRRL